MWNTLDSYGNSSPAFLDEGELAQTTDSSYKRHAGGNYNGKEITNKQETDDIVSDSKN